MPRIIRTGRKKSARQRRGGLQALSDTGAAHAQAAGKGIITQLR
jgi:hypothetical protein